MASVTVVIPTYNRARMLVQAVEGVLSQTRPPEEIVIVDDGSSDDTESAVARFGSAIRYVRQANAGPAAARNLGMRLATGDLIALLDSDDLWPGDKLASQLALLESEPDLDLVFGMEAKSAETGAPGEPDIRKRPVHALMQASRGSAGDLFHWLTFENVIPTSTALFRRSCLQTTGYIDESLRQAEDYDFWFRFAVCGFRAGFIDKVLTQRRIHGGNLVHEWANRTLATVIVLSRHRQSAPSPALSAHVLARVGELHYDLGSHFLRRREFSSARTHLCLAMSNGRRPLMARLKLVIASSLGLFAKPRAN